MRHRLILGEVILSPQFGLFLLALGGEVTFPARTEVDVPTPEASHQRIGFSVIVSSQFTILTLMCHILIIFLNSSKHIEHPPPYLLYSFLYVCSTIFVENNSSNFIEEKTNMLQTINKNAN